MFKLTIETGNAAFEDDGHAEVARILRVVAVRVEHGDYRGLLSDYNGNHVGNFKFEEGEDHAQA